jgi:micrococcal nuclease
MVARAAALIALLSWPAMAEQVTVARVLDGDTFVIDYPCSPLLPGKSLSIRLFGIDTPESHRNIAKCEAEVDAGTRAADFMRGVLKPGARVDLTVMGPDKYACRIDAMASLNGVDLATLMIKAGHARAYDGGTKSSWCE